MKLTLHNRFSGAQDSVIGRFIGSCSKCFLSFFAGGEKSLKVAQFHFHAEEEFSSGKVWESRYFLGVV